MIDGLSSSLNLFSFDVITFKSAYANGEACAAAEPALWSDLVLLITAPFLDMTERSQCLAHPKSSSTNPALWPPIA